MIQNQIPCVFIDTENGIPIYNLEHVEYWIKDDNGERLVPLKDIDVNIHTKIFISGLSLNRLVFEVSDNWHDFSKNLLYMLYSRDSKIITDRSNYFSGTNIYDFTINKSYLSKLNSSELESILFNVYIGDKNYYRINKQNVYPKCNIKNEQKIYSFNFVKQLKSIALNCGYNLNFNFHEYGVYWTFDNFVKSDINNKTKDDVKDEEKYYTIIKNPTNMYLGQYHNIVNIIKNIIDPNFNSFDTNTGNKINE